MNSPEVLSLRSKLTAEASPVVRESAERFFKEEVRHIGLTVPAATKIGNAHLKSLGPLSKEAVFALCSELFESGFQEEALIACEWAYAQRKAYTEGDLELFYSWLSTRISNWATCDTLCNHTVGTYIQMYPGHVGDLTVWARSSNRWIRRGAAVTLIIPARNGLFHDTAFEIACILGADADDLVQKGWGWLLKAVSESDQRAVFDFVMARRATMPRTALRYAIEKMPQELRTLCMKKD